MLVGPRGNLVDLDKMEVLSVRAKRRFLGVESDAMV